jgi:uncharacterized DUF497 family protein
MRFHGFEWDDGNWPKCGKHGLSKQVIESVFELPVAVLDDPFDPALEPRLRAIGKDAAGRHIFIVFCPRTKNDVTSLRPISARYMHFKEVKHYEEQKA